MKVDTTFSEVKIFGFPNRPRIEFYITNRKTQERKREVITTGQLFGMPPKRGLKDDALRNYMNTLRNIIEDKLIDGWRPRKDTEKVVEEKNLSSQQTL